MKVQSRQVKNGKGETIVIPILDVRNSEEERRAAEQRVKVSNGNHSKYIPAKWGYGPNGPKKY